MNPTDSTQYVSQMAQFSSLSAMNTLATTATSQLDAINTLSALNFEQYGASLIGKTVIVQTTNTDGTTGTAQGTVDNVDFTTDPTSLSIGGKSYSMYAVMKILSGTGAASST